MSSALSLGLARDALLVMGLALVGCPGVGDPTTPAEQAESSPAPTPPVGTDTAGPTPSQTLAPTPTQGAALTPTLGPTPGPSPTFAPTAAPTAAPTPGQTATPSPSPTQLRCAPSDLGALTLEMLADRFALEIYPLMARGVSGCANCHYPESGRLMTMGPSGSDTFYRLRAGAFLNGGQPGTMLARVSATDASAMPLGGPPWAQAEIFSLGCFVQDMVDFDAAGVLQADEEFPPNLLEPYDGPPHTDYDNTWLGYDALRGRVAVQFDDSWVREGVDNFSANIGLFGGVDFETTFSPVRQPTADYLLGLDLMARDVCDTAVLQGTGPFVGIDTEAPVLEEPEPSLSVFDASQLDPPTAGGVYTDGSGVPYGIIWSNGYMGTVVEFPISGDYVLTAWAYGVPAASVDAIMELRIDGEAVATFDVTNRSGWDPYEAQVSVAGGERYVSVWFTNDYCCTGGDRNLYVQALAVDGPVPGSTVGAIGAQAATRDQLATLMERVLFRAPMLGGSDELAPLYQLVLDLEDLLGSRWEAWSGVCELLVKHPDFLYTRAPYFDVASPAERERLIFLRTALDLVQRAPTPDEWARFDAGEPRMSLVAEWLESVEFLDAYFQRARVLFESSGSTSADEPARLYTWMFLSDRPIAELLTGEYTVNAQFQQRGRPDYHGPTGALTMPGYIQNKPGLPHYNYSARVLSDFMGYIFEVPPEIVDSRAGATAASTVDPSSVCYSCHQLLTPLAHQRLRWDDTGHYRDVDDAGEPIDDSDRELVEGYPYKGWGMAAFSAQAVRKERFIRRMVNTQAQLLLGRPLRYDEDERDLYYVLFNAADQGQGTFRDLMEILLESESYTLPQGGRYDDAEAP